MKGKIRKRKKGWSFKLVAAFEGSEFPSREAAEKFVFERLVPSLKKLEAECTATSIAVNATRTKQ